MEKNTRLEVLKLREEIREVKFQMKYEKLIEKINKLDRTIEYSSKRIKH